MKINAKGGTEFGRFDNTNKKLLSVSYEELRRRLQKEEKAKARKKKRKSAKTSAASRALGGVS